MSPPSTASVDGVLAEARRLVLEHGWNATAYQILNPGIERWFSRESDAVIGFVEAHGYRVVAGSPVCPPDRLGRVVEAFEEECSRQGLRSCYFGADERLAGLLRRRGPLDRFLLGAQPVWNPARWPETVAGKASLRAQLYRAHNKGVRVEAWPPSYATEHSALQRCLDDWLSTRGMPPLHFLIEPETLGRLSDRRIFVASLEDEVVAFLIASPVPRRRGWLVEQTVRRRIAPNGSCEVLLDAAMRSLAEEGAAYVTLGLCPLSQRSPLAYGEQAWWIQALLAGIRAYGRRFYDFEGLDAYKAKFQPESWEPVYAISGERRIRLATLYAIAGAFGRTSPLLLLARALGRAARQEVLRLSRREPASQPSDVGSGERLG